MWLLLLYTVIVSILPLFSIPTTPPILTHCEKIADGTPGIISKVTIYNIKLSSYNTAVGTVAKVSCLDDALVVSGADTLTCLPNGRWSSDKPTCKEPEIVKPKDYKLIIGLSVGGACLVLVVIITGIIVKNRQQTKKLPSEQTDARLNAGHRQKTYSAEMKTRYTEQETNLENQPHVYKVWSQDRSLRKFITAFDLIDLKQKASKVFEVTHAYIVLEDDGTEIDDTTALEACKDKTLQVLSKHQSWTRNSYSSNGSEVMLDLRGGDNSSTCGTIKSFRL